MRVFDLDDSVAGDLGHSPGAGAVAIGNFDGVHLGHRQVIGEVVERAKKLGVISSVMTFEPYPREYFNPTNAPARLTTCRQKMALFAQTGINRAYCARFGKRLATTTAEDFVNNILLTQLNVTHVTVGADFRFGRARQGDVGLLADMGARHGFGVSVVADVENDGNRISSSRIRALLAEGRLEDASKLLGRPFAYSGRVIHGDKRGRTWGFPTANFAVRRDSFPLSGVFVVEVSDTNGFHRYGVANVGRRPTINSTRLLIEAFLFDFSGDLYGQRLQVTFLERIREERRFESFDALKQQIGEDIEFAHRQIDADIMSDSKIKAQRKEG
ncbi:MAG: riboflavin biosynthesis protein [marine bacterium B5-7]|nr:MAG: riboflavin biosynthesis protein [marine bacterium B5-7]